jgi:hypothetical protein
MQRIRDICLIERIFILLKPPWRCVNDEITVIFYLFFTSRRDRNSVEKYSAITIRMPLGMQPSRPESCRIPDGMR